VPHVALPDLVPGHWPAFISVPAVDSSGSDSLVFLYRALRMLDLGWTSLILALESPSWTSSAVFTFRVPSVVIPKISDRPVGCRLGPGGDNLFWWNMACHDYRYGWIPSAIDKEFPTYPGMKS
jgi:hypothetical protein